jgi:DeoR/GlpR family transcriptional regulator of sugar metabolism
LSSRSVTTNVSVKKRRHEDVVLERLSELEQATVTELAHSLDASVSTVLRALRQLVKERRVVRFGKARATRYKPNRGLTAPVG